MAIITAHTIFSDSIDIANGTGELRTKAVLEQEFKKEYETFSFGNHQAFDLEMKILMSKLEADIGFLTSVYKKKLIESLLTTKEQVEEVMLKLEASIILLDSYIAERKAQLSHIEKYRAKISIEEGIAKKRNIDFGILISYAKTTAGYLSYVLTVAPEQLTDESATSPLTRFKSAKAELKNALISFGYGSLGGSNMLDTLKAEVALMDTSLTPQIMPAEVPEVVIVQNEYQVSDMTTSVNDFKTLLDTLDIPALTLPSETIARYFSTFGIENEKRGETVLAVEVFEQKIRKTLIELMLSGRSEIRLESIGAEAKLNSYINEIQKKRHTLQLKMYQLEEASTKVEAGAQDIIARIAGVQNFYDNLLRQGTEIMGSYANSVVSSVPANASSVIAEFKEFLDMQQKEIDVRI